MIRVTSAVQRAGWAVLLGLTVATCRDDSTGPGRGQLAYLALAPVLPQQAANLAAFGLAIDSLRVVVVRPETDTLVDTTVAFAADQDSIALALPLTLTASTETFDVTLELRGGGFVLFSATTSVDVQAGAPGTNAPVEISNFVFTGPGAGVTSLLVSPVDSVIRLGDSLRFRVDAFAGAIPVTQFYVSWSTDNASLAPINAHGVLDAPNQRGRVVVTATTPTDVTGSVPVTFVPAPTAVVAVPPIPQNVLPGVPIGPLRAQVLAGDGLGVKGIPVSFQAVSGGGAVTNTVVVTDSGGFAQTPATSGTGGISVFSATVAGVAAPALFNVTVVSTTGTQLAFAVAPAGEVVGLPLGVVVEVRDAQGNVATSAADPVTIALGANPGGATLGGTATVNAAQGLAVFSDLTINQPGTGYTLVATAPGLTAATTPPFSVAQGFAGRLWTNVAGGNWSDPANWSGNLVPGVTDTVYIALPGNYTVNVDVSATVTYLFVGSGAGTQTLSIANHTLTVDSVALVAGNAQLVLSGATVNGSLVSTTAGTTVSQFNSTIAPDLSIGGTLIVDGSAFPSIGGTLNVLPGATVRVTSTGQCCQTTLTVADGVANAGLIELTSAAALPVTLNVTNGALYNAPGATVTALAGAGGARAVNASLDNQGTMAVATPLTVTKASAQHANSGSILVTGGGLNVSQSGALAAFTTTGQVLIGAGYSFGVTGGFMQYNGGAIEGTGTLALSNVTLALGAALTHDTLSLSLTNATVNGPSALTVAAGRTLTMVDGAINAPLVINGTLEVDGAGFPSLGGSVGLPAGGTLRVTSTGVCCQTTLNVASGFTNNGLIELTSAANFPTSLNLTSGTLTNAAGATLRAHPGSGGTRTLGAELVNQGAVEVAAPLTLSRTSAAHANLTGGQIDVSGGDLTVTQAGTGAGFTVVDAVLHIDAGRRVNVSGGAFVYGGAVGFIDGAGTLALSTVTWDLQRTIQQGNPNIELNGTVVNGTGSLVIPAGATLRLVNGAINASVSVDGTLEVDGSGFPALGGPVATGTNSTIRVTSTGVCCQTTLNVTDGFTINGRLELTSAANFPTGVNVGTGALVVAADATLEAMAGAGGAHSLNAVFDNQGTLLVGAALSINKPSAAHLNSGSVMVTGGDLTLTQTGGAPSFTTSGQVTIGAGRTLAVTGGNLTYNSGAIDGTGTLALTNVVGVFTPPFTHDTLSLALDGSTMNGPGALTVATGRTLTIVNGTINAPLVINGTLVVDGAGFPSIGGTVALPAGGTLRVTSSGTCCQTTLNVATGFTNSGLIELTSAANFPTTLNVAAGTLVNDATGTIHSIAGAGGSRSLGAQLDNQGIVVVDAPLTVNRASATHTNDGTVSLIGGDLTITQTGTTPSFTNTGIVNVGTGRTLAVTGGSAMNDAAGVVAGSGTVTLAGTAFSNNGTFAPGGSAGTLTLNGAYPATATSALSVEIGGLAAGTEYDQLAVSGTATLGGTLNVTLINGFLPAVGNSFTILTAGSVSGGFALQNLPTVAGAAWQVTSTSTSVVLSLISGTQAAVKVWATGINGNWSDPLRWAPPGVPTATDSVVITALGTYTVTVDLAADAFYLDLGGPIGTGTRTLSITSPTLTLASGGRVSPTHVLNLSGGTLTGGGAIQVDGTMNWTGGTVSGAGFLTVSPAGTLSLAGGARVLATRTLLNQGSVLWTAGNINGSGATIQNAGTLDVQADAAVAWVGGTVPVLDNQATGTVLRRVATGAVVIDVTVNNAGTFDVQTGRVELSRGGSSTADFTVQPGAALEFAANTYTLGTGTDFGGAGVVELTNAVLDVVATDTVQVSRLHQLGGTLQGSGVLRPDSLVWTAGTQAGAGATHIAAGATMLVNSAGSVSWQRPLVNQGTLLWTSGNISGTSVTLLNTGLFDMQAPAATLLWGSGTTPVLDNQGTVLRRVGTGALTVDVTLTNAGTFDVQTGRVEFTRGGTTSTDLTVQPGTTLEFAAGTYVLGTSADIVGTGLVELTSAVLDIAATDTVQVSRLHQLGGTLLGTGALRPDSLVWTAGTQAGTGSTYIAPGAALLVNGSITWARPLVNQGTILWTAGNMGGGNVTLQNAGLFDIQLSAGSLSWTTGSVPTLDNQAAGTVLRRVGTGAVVVDVTVNNAGTFDVQTGRVELTRGGSSTTDFSVQPGTTLEFAAGSYALNTGMDVTGTGLVELTGGAVLDVTASDTVRMSRLHQLGGTIQGTGVLRPDSLVWTAGTQAGTGSTYIAAGAALLVNGSITWARPLMNQGTIFWTAGNMGGGNVTLQNAGLFDIQLPAGSLSWTTGSVPTLDNQATGTVLRRVGTGAVVIDVTVTNAGVFNVQTGRVELTRGGSSTTDFSVQAGTTLEFAAGSYNLATGADFAGTGLVEVTGGGIVDVAATDTVRVSRLHQLGGTIQGTGVLRPDSLVWTSGLQQGTGATQIAAGATLLVNGSITWVRPLVNQGTILWTAGNMGGGSVTLQNAGLFDVRANANLFWATGGVPPVLDNQAGGSVLRRVGTGVASFSVTVNNAGTLDAQTGILSLDRGGSGSGVYTVSVATAQLRFGGSGAHTLGAGAKINGAGVVNFTGVDVSIGGTGSSYDVTGTTQIVAGIITLNTPDTARFTTFNQLGGTLRGSAPFLVRGAALWNGGALEGAAGSTMLVPLTASLTLTSASTRDFNGRTIRAFGPVSWAGGSVNASNGAVLDIQPSTTFDVSSTGQWRGVGGATPVIEIRDRATMKVSTAGSVSIGPTLVLNNGGTLDIQGGATLKVSGDFNNLSTGELLGSGTLDVGGSPKVTNVGDVRPGTSPGILTIVGNWPQSTGSVLNIDVVGPPDAPGTGFDRLVVTGTITTGGAAQGSGGTLHLFGNGTFQPIGNYTILTYGARAGVTFDNVATFNNLPAPRSITYTATSLILTW